MWQCPLTVRWFVTSVPPGGSIELVLVSGSALQLVITKPVVCAILSGMVLIKDLLLLIRKVSP